ncbi:hypothetical protein K0M31_019788 [Melipona bicolor]|uniref:Uncharacterized protein n=1 Tax=Melipona bicolor TaxID=60889 RepID=A0AA40G3I1_9HYME|nr:hypothetical protein K0M31_019788 [Melipona bicolor]
MRAKDAEKREREERGWRQGYEKVKERVARSYSLTRRVKFSAGFTTRPTYHSASLVTQNYNVEAPQKSQPNDTGTPPLFVAMIQQRLCGSGLGLININITSTCPEL